MASDSLEALEEKMATYRTQLAAVDKAIEVAPSDDLSSVRLDILEAIALTDDLIKGLKKSGAVSFEFRKGSQVEVFDPTSETWKRATVTDIQDDTYIIHLIGTTDSVQVTRDLLRSWKPAPKDKTPPVGAPVRAVFSADGLWYNAVVDKIFPGPRFLVTYTDYGNRETLDEFFVVLNEGGGGGGRKRAASPALTAEVLEGLKILPTDSDEAKERKRKKLHALKSAERLKRATEERKAKQTTWKSFVTKTTGRHVTGFITTNKKESIFKTPDNPLAKVGVTGSGNRMTEFSKTGKMRVMEVPQGE
jgi:survival of motor neuron-related-splicing factor 30